jgi:hypothetical protein
MCNSDVRLGKVYIYNRLNTIMVKSRENLLGAYAFLVGVILAVLVGLLQRSIVSSANNVPYIALVLIGILVGFLNVGDKDSLTFLFASVSLVILSGFGQSALIYLSTIPILSSLSAILAALLIMLIPATIIVALKTAFSIAKI